MNNLKNITRFCLICAVAAACSATPPQQEQDDSGGIKPITTTIVPTPTMPDVVCMNLQDAQDLIQEQGVFFSKSVDATGQGRNQIVDSNWVVIEQQPEPGSAFTEYEALLSVLKEDELPNGTC